MNQYHVDSHRGQQHDVLHNGGLQLLADHGIAAVFDDHGLARVLLDIRKGLGEHLSPLRCCKIHRYVHCSVLPGQVR